MITLIAAIGKNRELGYKNHLIWNIPEDLKFFKNKTLNHIVVMGKNTYLSLPKKLANRHNIVISKSLVIDDPDIEVIPSCDIFLEKYKNFDEEIFIIGGESVYKYFINIADRMYLTIINDSSKSDVYFPEFNNSDWNIEELDSNNYKGILYKRYKYERK